MSGEILTPKLILVQVSAISRCKFYKRLPVFATQQYEKEQLTTSFKKSFEV